MGGLPKRISRHMEMSKGGSGWGEQSSDAAAAANRNGAGGADSSTCCCGLSFLAWLFLFMHWVVIAGLAIAVAVLATRNDGGCDAPPSPPPPAPGSAPQSAGGDLAAPVAALKSVWQSWEDARPLTGPDASIALASVLAPSFVETCDWPPCPINRTQLIGFRAFSEGPRPQPDEKSAHIIAEPDAAGGSVGRVCEHYDVHFGGVNFRGVGVYTIDASNGTILSLDEYSHTPRVWVEHLEGYYAVVSACIQADPACDPAAIDQYVHEGWVGHLSHNGTTVGREDLKAWLAGKAADPDADPAGRVLSFSHRVIEQGLEAMAHYQIVHQTPGGSGPDNNYTLHGVSLHRLGEAFDERYWPPADSLIHESRFFEEDRVI